MTALFHIQVRRDAHTLTPVTVPEYEVPILQTLFGAENVHNAQGKRVDEVGLSEAAGSFVPGEDEYTRLCVKYGEELIEGVYGKRIAGALDKAIESANAKPKSKSAKE